MHLGSVLLSIQSLLCNNPLHNEPGFEGEVGKRNNLYNLVVEYDNYNHLIKNNGFKIHPMFQPFNDIIKNHLRKEKKYILEKLNKLAKKHFKPAKISLNIYNIVMSIDYSHLKGELSEKFELLE
jgi:hypothetical protein